MIFLMCLNTLFIYLLIFFVVYVTHIILVFFQLPADNFTEDRLAAILIPFFFFRFFVCLFFFFLFFFLFTFYFQEFFFISLSVFCQIFFFLCFLSVL